MNYLQQGVLILHNVPRSADLQPGAPRPFPESDAGVMEEVVAVADALGRSGIPYRIVPVRALQDLPEILTTTTERIVFNLVEGFLRHPAEATLVPTVCLAYGKMCTGGDANCLTLSLDKWRSKSVLQSVGVPVPEAVLVPVGAAVRAGDLPGGPYIVKPVSADASEGIDARSVVREYGPALQRAVARVHKHMRQPALVEQFFGHRELNVSLLQRDEAPEILPIAEIDFTAFDADKPKIVDYAAKWIPGSFAYRHTPRIIPTRLPERVAEQVRRHALAGWHALGCRDYIRVDLRLDEAGLVRIIEINPNPDVSPGGGFAAALSAARIPYATFVKAVCRNVETRLREHFGPPPPTRRRRVILPRNVSIRRTRPGDRESILQFVRETGFFRDEELEIAREVLEGALDQVGRGHYQSYALDMNGQAVGWVCFGATPCTAGTYDIYWLVVDSKLQSHGFGRALLDHAERRIRKLKGRLIIVETSSRPLYDITRSFYARMGYAVSARVRDFYAPGDDRIVYAKRLDA